jgi:hypothetical protein
MVILLSYIVIALPYMVTFLPQGLPLGRKLSQFFSRPGKVKFSLGNLKNIKKY